MRSASRRLLALGLLAALAGPARAQSPAAVHYGQKALEGFGSSVVGFTDFDGDGLEDFAVAIPFDNQQGRPLSGSVKIFAGFPAYERLNLLGTAAGDLFGASLARVPDLDCDGVDELLVGAPGAAPQGVHSGEAIVFSGADARILFRVPGAEAGDECGAAVCAVGDVDRDGTCDFAVGSPGARGRGRDSGVVRVYDGASLQVIYTFSGDGLGERFGTSLAGPGDMDGDGIPELAVGAPCPKLARPGYARVLAGADASILASLGGFHTWEQFGATLAAVGDADGDGRADLLVGAPLSRSGSPELEAAVDHARGAATLFSGRTLAPLFVLAGAESEDRFGSALARGPDLDGDGADDLLVGAPQRLRPRAGCVTAYSARTGRELGAWVGLGGGDQFGSALAALRAADGRAFLLAGAPGDKNILTSGSRGASVGSAALVELLPRR